MPEAGAAKRSPRRAAARSTLALRLAVGSLVRSLFRVRVPDPRRTSQQRQVSSSAAERGSRVLRAEHEALEHDSERLQTDAEIERLARERYRLVRPGRDAVRARADAAHHLGALTPVLRPVLDRRSLRRLARHARHRLDDRVAVHAPARARAARPTSRSWCAPPTGAPVVIRNAPLLDDGTPMPTRYWLVDPESDRAVRRLEAAGGVRAAGAGRRSPTRSQPRTTATRPSATPRSPPTTWARGRAAASAARAAGVKCLHAHYAWYLAGGDDPVGAWVGPLEARPDRAGRCAMSGGCGGRHRHQLGAPARRRRRRAGADARARHARPADADHPARSGRRRDRAPASRRDRAHGRRAARVPRRRSTRLGVRDASARRPPARRATPTNRDEFFDPAEHVLGLRPELLERRGGGAARRSSARPPARARSPRPYLVVDVGGGSTEFVVGTDAARGCDLGRHRLRARSPSSSCTRPARARGAEPGGVGRARSPRRRRARDPGAARGQDADRARGDGVRPSPPSSRGCAEYDRERIHHFRLTRAAAEDVFRTLATEPAEQRRHNPGLEPGRVDVIVGGAIVLVAVMRAFGFDEMLVSEADILDGLGRVTWRGRNRRFSRGPDPSKLVRGTVRAKSTTSGLRFLRMRQCSSTSSWRRSGP